MTFTSIDIFITIPENIDGCLFYDSLTGTYFRVPEDRLESFSKIATTLDDEPEHFGVSGMKFGNRKNEKTAEDNKPSLEEFNDCWRLKDSFKRLIELRRKHGFLTAKNLDDLLGLESENPYILYCGDKEKYRSWIRKEIRRPRKEISIHPEKYTTFGMYRKKPCLDLDLAEAALDDLENDIDEDKE